MFPVLSVATHSTLIKADSTRFKAILPAQVVPLLIANTFFKCPLSALLVAFQKVVGSANPLLPKFAMPVQCMSHCKFKIFSCLYVHRSSSRPRATSTSSREPLTNSTNATTLHKTFVRRIILLFKRIREPKRPRHSRRFSFIPPGFVTVDPTQFTKSARRRAIYVNF